MTKLQEEIAAARAKRDALRLTIAAAPIIREEEKELTGQAYKRRHGMCEDAPCCGCCGPQGDGDYYGSQGDY